MLLFQVVMAISYYFDKAEYAGRDLDFDPSLYVAGGVACWDMEAQDWSWMVHLDLTTDKTKCDEGRGMCVSVFGWFPLTLVDSEGSTHSLSSLWLSSLRGTVNPSLVIINVTRL